MSSTAITKEKSYDDSTLFSSIPTWKPVDLATLLSSDYAHILFTTRRHIAFFRPALAPKTHIFIADFSLFPHSLSHFHLLFIQCLDSEKGIELKTKISCYSGQSCTELANHIYFFGGDTRTDLTTLNSPTAADPPKSQKVVPTNDLYDISLSRRSVTRISPRRATPRPRLGHTMVARKDSVILFGGHDDSKFFNDLYEYKPGLPYTF